MLRRSRVRADGAADPFLTLEGQRDPLDLACTLDLWIEFDVEVLAETKRQARQRQCDRSETAFRENALDDQNHRADQRAHADQKKRREEQVRPIEPVVVHGEEDEHRPRDGVPDDREDHHDDALLRLPGMPGQSNATVGEALYALGVDVCHDRGRAARVGSYRTQTSGTALHLWKRHGAMLVPDAMAVNDRIREPDAALV